MFVSGIAALLLTFRKTSALSNVTLKPLQRILTIVLAGISLVIGHQIYNNVDSVGGKIIGGFGIATALVALYRVFKK
jgi:hypothetical protein